MIKRLVREVTELQRGDLSGIGIYTWFDERNLRKGKAMLIGPAGTPYAFCPLFFDIDLPAEYPLVPPRVTIETTDNSTRLHPNLYTAGKVCLSILGTYSGPSWVSTMNIETVLKSIYSLLNDNPIVNEPGWERYTLDHPSAKSYAEYVEFAMAKLTIQQFTAMRAAGGHPLWDPFRDTGVAAWKHTALPQLLDRISNHAAQNTLQEFESLIYGMSHRTADWGRLSAMTQAIKN